MSAGVLYQRDGDENEEGDSDAWDDTMLIKAYDNAVSAMKAKLAAQHPEYSTNSNAISKKKKKTKQRPKKKKTSLSRSSYNWKVGDSCQAVFTEDGLIYSAQILSIVDDACMVRYVEYGNEERQMLSSLLPALNEPSSQDNITDTASEIEVAPETSKHKQPGRRKSNKGTYVGGQTSKSTTPSWNWNNFTVPPPPPPPSAHHFPPFPHHPSCSTSHFPPMFPGIPPPPPLFSSQDAGSENEALYSMLISWYMSGYHTGYYQGLKNAKASSHPGGPFR